MKMKPTMPATYRNISKMVTQKNLSAKPTKRAKYATSRSKMRT